ncbi:retrovirus-related pol polyprotein from transposon TNT 1-94 [Tanacetum coccineum]
MISDFVAMISEVNLVGSNTKEWWIDTSATRHLCLDKSLFSSFKEVINGAKLFMETSVIADIKGEGDVILKWTSGKELKLKNFLYVPKIRKNIMSRWLLNMYEFLLAFECNTFELTKNKMVVGTGYARDGMFSKDEAIDKFILYKNEVENQLNKDIKNGIAERKNCTLKEMANAMLISLGLNQNMWKEAILSANYLLNKIPHKKKEETPYELWLEIKPSYKCLRVWGCLAKVAIPTPKAQKIGPKTVDCVFIGNASFFKIVFPCLSKENESSSRRDDVVVQEKRQQDDDVVHDERHHQSEEEDVEPRRSKRARIEKSFGPDFVSFMVESEPNTYREAVISSEWLNGKKPLKVK